MRKLTRIVVVWEDNWRIHSRHKTQPGMLRCVPGMMDWEVIDDGRLKMKAVSWEDFVKRWIKNRLIRLRWAITIRPIIMPSYRPIVDLKRQNRLKVGTDKPELKDNMQSVLDDDVQKILWKATLWAGSKRYIQTGKIVLHLPAGHSRSLGQQPIKHGYRRLIAWPAEPVWIFRVHISESAQRFESGRTCDV